MHILQTMVDSIGDVLGTSEKAKFNRKVFRPAVGTDISRKEYNRGIRDSFQLSASYSDTRKYIENGGADRRKDVAQEVLQHMDTQGVQFSKGRLSEFILNLQTSPGENPIYGITANQLSFDAHQQLKAQLGGQHFRPLVFSQG